MWHRSTVPSPKGVLSLHEVLQLTSIYLENATRVDISHSNVALVLFHNAEVALDQAKRSSTPSLDPDEQDMQKKIAAAYHNLGKLLEDHGLRDQAVAFYNKCKTWSGHVPEPGQLDQSPQHLSIVGSIKSVMHSTTDVPPVKRSKVLAGIQFVRGKDLARVSPTIFPKNVDPLKFDFSPPEPDSRLTDTPQLARCLAILQDYQGPINVLDMTIRNWIQAVNSEPDELDRLKSLATDVIRAFKRDELKDAKAVTEVIYLTPVLEEDDFRYLLKEFHTGIEQSKLLDVNQLEGLAQLIQGANTSYLNADDLEKVLTLLSTRLRGTHHQSPQHIYKLILAVSNVLDAMADANVKGLDRETVHEPLKLYLDGLRESSDPYLMYQAAYAYQALLYVPDNESIWQATLRRTGKVLKGVSGLVSAVKGLDLNAFVDGLANIQKGLGGASEIVKFAKEAYEGATALAQGGKGFLDLKEGLSFSRKSTWYPALRGADTMIQEGRFADFRQLVCEAPCRRHIAFQWGVCQRLGDIAANMDWGPDIQQGAMAFLGEIYRDDIQWGQHVKVKQWVLNILMLLPSESDAVSQYADSVLQELESSRDASKMTLYQSSREAGHGSHPLKIRLPALGSPSLLDRVQERPDVEGNIRQLRRQRLKQNEHVVYIQPQAKANLLARDEVCFPLMDKVDEFLDGDQKVFLLLGDSGAGKSTFNRALERELWERYKKNSGEIPLFINLPAIDNPEHDMIPKQLRKVEFTEPQIRELKLHRSFILICDGYDESQQTHNLYSSNRLNMPGEWNAKMVISCRSEYLGTDYRDRFQPGDRNQLSQPSLLQEAVITPFSMDQVQEYIDEYVSIYRPLWEADDYRKALEVIPSLKDLVKNPFLMSLSLEVLPRMVDPTQNLSATHITRVSLYDQFVEHWLERGKKRLGEKILNPQSRAAFESLIDEGFTRNGIAYLKKLSAAIYDKQGGQPIVSYSRYKDEKSWKAEFFSREEEKHLLREACPLVRNGNQHRFIHRSLLEYGVALAIFDPQDQKEKNAPESIVARRGSTSSVMSFNVRETVETLDPTDEQERYLNSPLVWRSFVNDLSVLQFLEDRVRQESLFKQELLDYIAWSKSDKKWRTAAANAITILVRVGQQFNHADFQCIQIPGADLSYGVFESAQFQGADLRQVNLQGAWLQYSDLSNAQMTGVQFGELPYLPHSSRVTRCAYSPDGKTLSTALDNGAINVYSTSTWERTWTKDDHKGWIWSIVYSPSGNQLASCSDDRTVRLWNIEDGSCLHVLSGHRGLVGSICYSPGGDQLASASGDQTVMIWDVESGQCRHILIGHTSWVYCVVYSPKGDQIASSSEDGSIRLWSIGRHEYSQVLAGHTGWVEKLVYSPQGHQLASGSHDSTIRLWDATTGEFYHVITGQSQLNSCVTYSPKGNQLASVGVNRQTIELWNIETGSCLRTLRGHSDYIRSLAYSPNGDLIASASEDNTVRLWDSETGVCRQILTGHSGYVNDAVFLRGGNRVISISDDMSARLWDTQTGRYQEFSSGHSDAVQCIKLSPKGGHFATGSSDHTMRIWDMESGSCIHTMAGHAGTVASIAYSPKGDYIASTSVDKTAKVWSVKNGDHLYSFSSDGDRRFGDDSIDYVDVSPCGSQIATSHSDKTVRLWSAKTKECYRMLKGHSGKIWKVAYSPTGVMIASCSEDCTVRLWEMTTGICRHILEGHPKPVWSFRWSPSGDLLASGSSDGSIRLWDTATGTSFRTMTGHTGPVLGIVYSPRGDVLVSGSYDKTMRLWDVASGQCHIVIKDPQHAIMDMDWKESVNGGYLVAGFADGGVWVFKVVDDGDQYQFRVHRRTIKGGLNVKDVTIQDVQGLSHLNKKLLKQRGAVGDPADHFLETSERVLKMASVVSRLRTASTGPVGDSATKPDIASEELDQRVEEVTNHPVLRDALRDVLTIVVRRIH